ncbi:MAG: twin-arginine translocase TatA/TatE family subunit [Propionibacteriaceae bacterium]|jgi:sec-independent protein translocase protein TatA|nr:twin-arginine translocase TatA/TatE family subunit [Propionibacteriaceae bacterium]
MGPWEIVIICVAAVVLFGGAKIAGLGKNAGKAIHDFKAELNKDDKAEAEKPTEAGQ